MKKIFMSAAMLCFLVGCTNEELGQEAVVDGIQSFTLSAHHGMASRTILNGEQTWWSEGDQIYVSSADGKVYGTLTLESGANTDCAIFTGWINGDASKLAYTIFPAPKNGNAIDLSNRDASTGELDAPMIGTFGTDKSSVAFKNEAALVKLPVTGLSGNQTVTLKGSGIGGTLVPKQNSNGQWELVYETIGNEITIENAKDLQYIPVATTGNKEANINTVAPAAENVTLEVKVENGNYSSVGSVTVQQGNLPVMDNATNQHVSSNGDVQNCTLVKDATELSTALTEGKSSIKLTNNITATSVLEISEDVVIDGNGKTINSSASRIFRLTESKINVVMNDLNMVSSAVRNGQNDIRGISIDLNLEGIGLALDGCSIHFTDPSANDWTYGVNVCGGTSHCGITILGGSYQGANVVNVWGNNHGITIDGAVLTSLYGYNALYTGVCVSLSKNDSNPSTGNVLTVKNSTFNGEHAVGIEDNGDNNKVTSEGNTDNTKIIKK